MCGGLYTPSASTSPPFHILAVSLRIVCSLRKVVQVLTVLSSSVAVMLSRSLWDGRSRSGMDDCLRRNPNLLPTPSGTHHPVPGVTAVTQSADPYSHLSSPQPRWRATTFPFCNEAMEGRLKAVKMSPQVAPPIAHVCSYSTSKRSNEHGDPGSQERKPVSTLYR